MEDDDIITITADIVAAHVSNNTVAVGDVSALVQQVYSALTRLGGPVEPSVQRREPAVSVRSSVKPDHLVCLVCGEKAKMLKRHIQSAHQLTPEEYRQEFELGPSYPMVAPEYAARRAEIAKASGLGTRSRGKPRPKRRS